MTEVKPFAAVSVREWIQKGSPKDTWFRIIRDVRIANPDKAAIASGTELCVRLIKNTLESYGSYQLREPILVFGESFDIHADKNFTGYITPPPESTIQVCTEAMITDEP